MAAITHDISICRLPRNSITRSTSRLTSPRTYSSRAESHAAAGSSIAGADRVGPRNDKSSKLRDLRVELRVAKRKDYWAISHMHCGVFYPEAKFPGDALLR